jgi:putative ABC transport system permease protein
VVIEDLLFALKTFRRNKTRTVLSLLGVIIGVASVIVITSLGESATGNVKKSFGSANLDLINVSPGFSRRGRVAAASAIQFNEAFREEIFGRIGHIKKIWYNNTLTATLLTGDLSYNSSVTAVEYGYLEMCVLRLTSGDYFTASDDVQGLQTVILGSQAAEALFPDGNAVGSPLILQNGGASFGFTVIGVLASTTGVLESGSTGVYVPRGFYTKKISPSASAAVMVIQATEPKYAAAITAGVRVYAEEKAGDSYALGVMSMQTVLEQYDEVNATLTLLLSGIAAISLLVGGIGIMNIMIVTVTERKKEIGIRKAIGATPAAIRAQFLVESAAITLLGGILGIAVGVLISAVVSGILKWAFAINVAACLVAFLFSAFVGVFFGFNPASRAARLDPVAALAD